jgi:hypothetical protein
MHRQTLMWHMHIREIFQLVYFSDRNSVTISSDRAYGFMVALKSVVGTMNSFFKEEKLDPDLTKNEKFTAPNKVLMVLGRRTGAHLEN